MNRLSVIALITIVSISYGQPMAFCAEPSSAKGSQGSSTKSAADESTDATAELGLENIQDVAYTLQRIRQQAINIYVEATRKKVHHYELNIPSLSSMPQDALESQSAYLPLRKAWLVFFIGTMEPLVQILNEHLKSLNERTEKAHVPSQYMPEWQVIVREWATAIGKLNKQLDVCATLVDDTAPRNVEVAQAAREIDKQVSVLESILDKASKFLQDKAPRN